uniref:Uncharacterized protein n=1 Tax=Physcomitrium patens TaxID=3218 RepID=A0A2K1JQ68_PHYPA|nr:hypothetical protein PHYPA_016067 [Physcomitrium patens]
MSTSKRKLTIQARTMVKQIKKHETITATMDSNRYGASSIKSPSKNSTLFCSKTTRVKQAMCSSLVSVFFLSFFPTCFLFPSLTLSLDLNPHS